MDKIEAIKAVLIQRYNCLRHILLNSTAKEKDVVAYYEGKKDGYLQAIDLLNDTIESICVELEGEV